MPKSAVDWIMKVEQCFLLHTTMTAGEGKKCLGVPADAGINVPLFYYQSEDALSKPSTHPRLFAVGQVVPLP
ncbi:unnamed protein product [Protopolystoma xenopodis]|uniref:Uncharacterized protein n=1 Tax=Protopolystoma xenopodis TaxID=117903 RepID=A0A3S5BQB9_9PLAT|nr:unnamed protein product [Protopolystoma xenopodis]